VDGAEHEGAEEEDVLDRAGKMRAHDGEREEKEGSGTELSEKKRILAECGSAIC
jgi:hypothetical protein